MSDTRLYAQVASLLEKAEEYESMTRLRQAAFKAQVSRLVRSVDAKKYPDAAAILDELAAEYPRLMVVRSSVTVEEVEKEFHQRFTGYDTGRRGAFKAKVTRLANTAEKKGEAKTVKRLAKLVEDIAAVETAEAKTHMMDLAQRRQEAREAEEAADAEGSES